MGLAPQSSSNSGSSSSSSSGLMPSQSRISAWFAALVVLAGSVFLLEYVVFFTSDGGYHGGGGGGGGRPPVQRTTPAATRPPLQVAAGATEAPPPPPPRVAAAKQQGQQQQARRLAVVVPSHAGDLGKALASLATWPTNCHESTLLHTDLVLYYAGGAEDDVEAVLPSLAKTGGRCFANTRLVLANLTEEENMYPKGPSVQFYKLYLDSDVRRQVTDYDALAIIEWDVIVAHDTSFEKLYAASFGGVEPFWIKGSTLEGVNFHETVVLPESRHVLGHINGNAVYNNTDPAFVEFVNFTLIRWEYTQSYDVALWATISDFPYSWPLWQRYSRKFVAIDLIANVGFQDMNDHAVRKAVASNTLFIHGSLTGGGGSMFHAAGNAPETSPALRLLGAGNRPAERCNAPCGGAPRSGLGEGGEATSSTAAAAAAGMSTVCDRSCYPDGERGARFGGHLCGAGHAPEYGAHCRSCFTDLEAAREAEESLAEEEQVALERRSAKRLWEGGKKQQRRRVLKADGRGGAGWEDRDQRDGGRTEEVVVAVEEEVVVAEVEEEEEDEEEEEEGERGRHDGGDRALRGGDGRVADAWRHGDDDDDDDAGNEDMIIERRRHVIMCDTLMPPPAAPDCSLKCQRKDDTVCDRSCGTGRFGDYNCNWRDHGAHCRFCFNDREKALVANEVANRRGGAVIMCHTLEPPTQDEDWTPPSTSGDDDTPIGASAEDDAAAADGEEKAPPKPLPVSTSDDDAPYDPANEPYAKGVTRGQICAFMTGFSSFLRETQVTVKSVMHFMPGMRMAIATQAEDVSVFERTLGSLPGVRVSEAISPITLAPLLADRHCGEGTDLILYMNPGELLSRKFTSKDTHSAAGDLLVMYAEVNRIGEASLRRTLATMSVLGFSSPSFSFGMDIMLPVDTNRQLRDVLLSDPEAVGGKARVVGREREALAVRELGKFAGVFVPEVLAALAYSRNEPGVWFINPQQWVTHHMFQPASIWDIPLVKPRFGCAFDISMAAKGYDVAAALETQLSHFVSGSSCERGFIHMHHGQLKPKSNIEFGYPSGKEMPSIAGSNLRVSVVFYAGRLVSPTLLDASIASVAARFPEAAEVVVIFYEAPAKRAGLKEVLKVHGQNAPFPVEAIEEDGPAVEPRGGWPGWSRMRVDDFATGEFVMQLEVGDLLVEDVVYDNIFHFGKSVIPFQRLSLEDADSWASPAAEAESYQDRYIARGIQTVIEMDALWDFALLRGLVYPRTAYSEMRMFANEVHNLEIDDLVQHAHKNCEGMVMGNGRPVGPTIGRGIFEANLLGAFMWRFMPDAVHWRALDPLDIQPDEWLSDVGKYNILCSMGNLQVPRDDLGAKRLGKALKRVHSRAACDNFAFNAR